MMNELNIGTIGRITAGNDVGRFVEIIDDSTSSGGFLILTFDNADRSGNAYDSWVESIADADLYCAESDWEIEWLD
jgi:hypothetical protein